MSRGEDIADKIRAGHDELFGAFEHLTSEQLLRPGLNGTWSIKDLIGHVGIYEWFVAELLRTRAWAALPPEVDLDDLDERNLAIYHYLADRPLDRIVGDEAATYADLLRVVRSLDDADLDDPSRLGLPDDPGWEPEDVIARNSHEHYPAHLDDVRRWVADLTD